MDGGMDIVLAGVVGKGNRDIGSQGKGREGRVVKIGRYRF